MKNGYRFILFFILGFYVEGKYLDYWERPAYDIKVGLNYQFVGFGS